MIHILLPAFNEEKALSSLFERFRRLFSPGDYHLWVVDDGSSDNTAGFVLAESHRMPVNLIQHERNAGLGAAWRSGLNRLRVEMHPGDILVAMDADDTHPVDLIPALTDPLKKNEADIAIASRFAPGARVFGVPLFRRFISSAASLVFRLLFPIPGVRDYTCGYRAYTAEILDRGTRRWGDLVTEPGFASTAEWLLRLSVLSPRVIERPIILRYDRKPTASKMPVLQTLFRAARFLLLGRRVLRGAGSS